MKFESVYIPYGAYWSTPFTRWQGSFGQMHPILFAAEVARRALRERDIALDAFDALDAVKLRDFLTTALDALDAFDGQ